ncbi:MAG TPA: serine O-acetyltransferase [Candidatus Krumholzibacteria bacterium]|nr:serine O-acetyltransferase [Candidatus Krumholzibacteria bacterium]HRX50494.1 serine O-acetyltransferase [Candidatus Krumholzibacteria bacterium]
MHADGSAPLRDLASRLAGTYHADGGINRIGDTELPSQQRVAGLVEQLLTLIFPGYFGGRISDRACMETFVASRIDDLYVELSEVVDRTLRFVSHEPYECAVPHPAAGGDTAAAAAGIVKEYLEQLPALRELVGTDVDAAYRGDPAATCRDEVILCYPGLLAVAVHRLAHPLYRLGVPFVPRIMNEWAHQRTGCDIHPGARIGRGFFIDHATGVVVGETTEIGENVKLYQGVTLGARSFKRRPDGSLEKTGKRHPTIEDDVTVYANATILGGDTVVGRGAVIGGGCWVTRSVAPGARLTVQAYGDGLGI